MALTLANLTYDFTDFVAQFENHLATRPTWKGNLTTMTSQTLIEMISAVGTYDQATLIRAYEDAFSETAQSDGAIRAITQMQGIRMARRLPSLIYCTLSIPVGAPEITIPSMTQFTCSGTYWFNRVAITISSDAPVANVPLYQGQIMRKQIMGLGTNLQAYIPEEDGFEVSDQDVDVAINGTRIEKAYGGLWNYKGQPAYSDLTLYDGRLVVQFGNAEFGSVPQTTDVVTVRYALTRGISANSMTTLGNVVTVDGFTLINGLASTNPAGGADEQSIVAYKNLASGAFGTYNSAVTGNQYKALVGLYPGVDDAITQAQREINPMALEWMNVVRVTALTSSPWTQQQKQDFINYMQRQTMYAVRFVWQDAIPIPRDIDIDVYCFNTAVLSDVKSDVEAAIRELFRPKPGVLLRNLYESDLDSTVKKAGKGVVSYTIINSPNYPMIVTAPPSPPVTYTILPTGGTLTELIYAYSVSIDAVNGDKGPPDKWVFPQIIGGTTNQIRLDWEAQPNVTNYRVWGRKAGEIGLIATLGPGATSFTDDGTIVPSGNPPNTLAEVPIRYNQLRSMNIRVYFGERQQRMDGTPYRGE